MKGFSYTSVSSFNTIFGYSKEVSGFFYKLFSRNKSIKPVHSQGVPTIVRRDPRLRGEGPDLSQHRAI